MASGQIDQALVERFSGDLDLLSSGDEIIGLAVSGGPDSLALLLLASEARTGRFEVATVDHGLRTGSAAEAEFVASVCAARGVAHVTLLPTWADRPRTAIQEKARIARYCALGAWASERRLSAIATAHHTQDQAETLLMRLGRGSGVRGLAAMRAVGQVPGCPDVPLIRPLLGWHKQELEDICSAAGVEPVRDPGNEDPRFERVRVRRALKDNPWLDTEALARSAANLESADEALEWVTAAEWSNVVGEAAVGLTYRPSAPREIRRRIVTRILCELGHEGTDEPRGREMDQLMTTLESAGTATLRGVRCSGGEVWRFGPAPARRQTWQKGR